MPNYTSGEKCDSETDQSLEVHGKEKVRLYRSIAEQARLAKDSEEAAQLTEDIFESHLKSLEQKLSEERKHQ